MSFIYLYSGLPPSLPPPPLPHSTPVIFFLRSSSPPLFPIFLNALSPFFPNALPCQLFDVVPPPPPPPPPPPLLDSVLACCRRRSASPSEPLPLPVQRFFLTRQMWWMVHFNIWLTWNHILSLKGAGGFVIAVAKQTWSTWVQTGSPPNYIFNIVINLLKFGCRCSIFVHRHPIIRLWNNEKCQSER